MGGRIVQLVQGERLALEFATIGEWIDRFAGWPKVQLIDLDAAKAQGDNAQLVERICGSLPCRVGGGIRSVERASEVLAAGATHAIVGSALFRKGGIDFDFAAALASTIGASKLIAAVDSKKGRVCIDGWRTSLPITAVEAVGALAPYFGGFLYTHVDREGLLQGTDMGAIAAVRAATTREVVAAGGITTMDEVEALDRMGVDAVVGMALYTGRLALPKGGSPLKGAATFSDTLGECVASLSWDFWRSVAPANRAFSSRPTLAPTSGCSLGRLAPARSARRQMPAPASTSSTS